VSLAEPRTLLERLIADGSHTWQELEARFDEQARVQGERVSVSWRQMQRIAAGQVGRPRPAVGRVLAELFGHTVSELLGPPPGATADGSAQVAETTPHREFLARVAAASIGVAEPESITQMLDGLTAGPPGRVGPADVATVESAIAAYLDMDQARYGEHAASFARGVLRWSTGLLDAEMSGPTRQRLSSSVALLCDRLGWEIHDTASAGPARRMLTFALDHAARGDDPDLRAHVMLDLSVVLADAGHPDDGIDVLRAALGDERISPAERANLHTVCAWHCALAHWPDSGLRHLRLAEEALTLRDGERGPEWAQRITYGAGHLDSAFGLAMFALGDETGARPRLQAATAELDRGRTRTGLRCRIRLAVLGLQEGDRAAGEAEGHRIVIDASGVRSTRIRRDLRMLRARAGQHGALELAALIPPD
jgi:hypothetical protein